MNRRKFTEITALSGTVMAAAPAILSAQGGNDKNVIRVGLIGCGDRGTGAVTQAFQADPNVKLVAMADAFSEPIASSLRLLASFGDRAVVPASRQFVGMDAYQKLLDSGVDVVLLAAPPGFRPQHLRASIDAGKHVFSEKPMAVDMAGVKSVLESAELAKKKSLSIQHGFCWRFAPAVREMYKRIHAGEWGRVISAYGTFLASPPKVIMPATARKPEWSDVEWQLRNWINFDHFSGGPLLEQAVHSVDKLAWAMNDIAPVAAVATGGLVRDEDGGNIYDHYSVAYEYPNGVFCHVDQRQWNAAHREVIDRIFCEKATVVGPGRPMAFGADKKRLWMFQGEEDNMYQVCHNEFFAAVREGRVISTGEYMANSTALGLMGREAAHSGKRVTWSQIWNSTQDLAPDDLKMSDSFQSAPIPQPGKYQF